MSLKSVGAFVGAVLFAWLAAPVAYGGPLGSGPGGGRGGGHGCAGHSTSPTRVTSPPVTTPYSSLQNPAYSTNALTSNYGTTTQFTAGTARATTTTLTSGGVYRPSNILPGGLGTTVINPNTTLTRPSIFEDK